MLNSSCKKENDFVKNNPFLTNPTSYILKRQIWTGPTANGSSFLYSYDTNHLISKIERYQWGTYSVNGGALRTWYDTAYYAFEHTNGLCTKWTIDEGGAKGYFLYEYNHYQLPAKRTIYYSNNTIQSYSFYKYNNSNNLIEKTDSSDKVNFKYEFIYNSSNNLISVTDNILWTTPQRKMKYEWPAFDDKVNFIKAVNGLPSTFVWDNNYHSYSSSSPNNFLSVNYYIPVNMDQPFEGLPTKKFYGPWIVGFEYEKYK